MAFFNSRVVQVRMQGAAGVGLTIGPGPGDFSHDPINSGNTEKLRVDDRGSFECYIEGNDLSQAYSITVTQRAESLTSALEPRVTDFIMRTGAFTKDTGVLATQSFSTNPNIWAWETIVTMTLGPTVATFKLPHCIGDYAQAEAMEGNTISIAGTNDGEITRT